jgi:hypothetical protein
MGEAEPLSGDLTICFYCGHLMAFADDLTLRALTDTEIIEAAGDPDLIRFQKVRAKVRVKK